MITLTAPLPAPPVSAEMLLGLLVGDEWTTGYADPCIVYELCKRTQPGSLDVLRKACYGDAADDLNEACKRATAIGYLWWERMRHLTESEDR